MVEAFTHPQVLEKQVLDLLHAIIKDRIKNIQIIQDKEGELSDYTRLLNKSLIYVKRFLMIL